MTASAPVRVMSTEEIAARGGGDTPYFQWPAHATVFAERSMRLRQLAGGHAMEDFLRFMADLAQAQQRQLLAFPAVPVPDSFALDLAARDGAPPLPAADWPRDPAWRPRCVHCWPICARWRRPARSQRSTSSRQRTLTSSNSRRIACSSA